MKYDLIVIGGGPAGQKAAVQAAKSGFAVALIDLSSKPGGECVKHGTIPSKTLRETALHLRGVQRQLSHLMPLQIPEDLRLESLMDRKREVIDAHECFLAEQMKRNRIDWIRGKARLLGNSRVVVTRIGGDELLVSASRIILATGSRPRSVSGVEVDHEHIFDSDSILSMSYLPRSLVVLGGGVIACEYASIFSALGTKVTLVHGAAHPLGFLDPEIVQTFVEFFEADGGIHRPNARIATSSWDGFSVAETRLEDGELIQSEIVLSALGRVAHAGALGLESAGVRLSDRGHVIVDAQLRTTADGVYAAGDIIGPPALASTSMEQGRRAACHALDLDCIDDRDVIPVGVYTSPELASVGCTEEAARLDGRAVVVGRAPFNELARGHISGKPDGLLKLVVDRQTRCICGVQIAGEGAAELLAVGQMAMVAELRVERLIDTVFNFPTLAEAYRVAALSAVSLLARSEPPAASYGVAS